jgi:tetratricopeptide (TPR) repeat protein
VAHYRAEEYSLADSIFGAYVKEHPEQGFGYYWQARSNAMMDKEMTEGLAVPYYQKLTEVMQNDTANASYKKWMVEAYGYMAAYNANTKKDYPLAISYFQKVLEVDPENADAKKYIAVLEKRGAKDEVKSN